MEIKNCIYYASERKVLFKDNFGYKNSLEELMENHFQIGNETQDTIIMVKPAMVLVVIDDNGKIFAEDMRDAICKYYNYPKISKKRVEKFINDYNKKEIAITENAYGEIIIKKA